MGGRLLRISTRSNTAPVKPQQLHYPPEGGQGSGAGARLREWASEARLERECVRMRAVCKSRIQSTLGVNGFGELRIFEVISFNKVIHRGPQCVLWCNVFIQSRSFLWIFISSSEETVSAICALVLLCSRFMCESADLEQATNYTLFNQSVTVYNGTI